MMAATSIHEFMSVLGKGIILTIAFLSIGWLGYCITSIARSADALERIANALEDDDDDDEEGGAK